MRQSQAFIQTLRDNPRDAEIVSQQLMMRSGMIRKHAAGIYSYLPLLIRSCHKFLAIVREEFDKIGWQEIIMPYAIPGELWKESGRWEKYGPELLRFRDRKGVDFCLGATHEEVVTDLVRRQVSSYKQLPVTLYQVHTKFRDEIRPRFGLMRGREFWMLDGYSFHENKQDLKRHYEEIAAAYCRVFERCSLDFVQVEADSGAMGGEGSHEFHVLAQSGEDCILCSEDSAYAANLEKAETPEPEKQDKDFGVKTELEPEAVETEGCKSIDDVAKYFNFPETRHIKALVYEFNTLEKSEEWKPLMICVVGNRQLSEVKLKGFLSSKGWDVLELRASSEDTIRNKLKLPIGYMGPVKSEDSILKVYDRELRAVHDGVCGANRPGFHWKHIEPTRDFPCFTEENIADVVEAREGDPNPRTGSPYKSFRGIEVGHIFQLGDEYSRSMEATVQSSDKEKVYMEMGCYGIGVTRTIAACIEQNHDENGIIWPESLAPYDVHLISLDPGDEEVNSFAEKLYKGLKGKATVLYDDRDSLSPGVKFKDSDLLGLPRRVVVGRRGLKNNEVEFSLRRDKKKVSLPSSDLGALISAILSDEEEEE